ncbi:putative inorganic phosphate cotransporter [Cephus cinctus]|uniref:Putative inorganic phosphate cotransporter n=1 Tax=Cephus cinctus TaxID=211228 RepID=A0AAJ7BY97_CEPCN|nr:putative inorganic phosphate cotransporter [Cephus cinctus]
MSSKILTKRISCAEFMKVPPRKPKARLGCRHLQIFLMTTGFLCCYAMRITMSVAIVAMVDAESSNPDYEEYNWSMAVQSTILSSFFWGYVLTQIPGGMIAQRWGARNLYGYTVCFCAIFSLGIPLAARYGGWQLVCACRVAMGLCQGAVLPILHTLLAKWAPLDERGTLGSFVYSGGWIGNVSSLLSSSFLAASPLGWPSCFYFWGTLSFLWSIIWMTFGSESPAEDSRISDEEKEYIEVSLGVTESTEPLKTPWLAIARSPAVWAIAMAQCAQAWGFWTLVSEIPSYLNSVLEFDIKEVGLYSALSYFTAWILGFPVSFVSDYFIKSNIISTTTSRKLCNTFGQWIPAIALIGLGFVRSDQQVLAVAILVVAVGTNIAIYCGHNVNHMDLSPNFAGTLMGCINAVANICGIVTPLIAGAIVTEKSNILQWRIVFTLSAGIYFLGNLGYLIFGSATVQKWNDLDTKTRA